MEVCSLCAMFLVQTLTSIRTAYEVTRRLGSTSPARTHWKVSSQMFCDTQTPTLVTWSISSPFPSHAKVGTLPSLSGFEGAEQVHVHGLLIWAAHSSVTTRGSNLDPISVRIHLWKANSCFMWQFCQCKWFAWSVVHYQACSYQENKICFVLELQRLCRRAWCWPSYMFCFLWNTGDIVSSWVTWGVRILQTGKSKQKEIVGLSNYYSSEVK